MKTSDEMVRDHMKALFNGMIFPVARGASGYAVQVLTTNAANNNEKKK